MRSVDLNIKPSSKTGFPPTNSDDFFVLHEADSAHSGILAVYQDAALKKAMNYTAIVRAIANLERTLPLSEQFIVLNQYNW